MANLFTPIQSGLSRIVQRFAGSEIQKVIEEKVKEQVSKAKDTVNAGDVLRYSPRSLSWPDGAIEKPYPLGVSFQTLRDFADFYPIARSCIEFRKSQITHLEYNITPVELNNETIQNKKNIDDAKVIKQFLKYPTGKKDSSMTNWTKQILEDLLVIDAVAVYRRRNRKGDVIGYLPIDGATIDLMLEADGTTPEPPDPAYVQKIHGQERAKLTTDDLIYAMMTPKTHSAYGMAPLESLIITVTTALKVQAYGLSFLTEGNIPTGFITLPRDIASSRDQLKEWQDAWDAMLAGDPRFQQKLKFLPEGMKYEPSVKAEDMTFERFEKWLLQCTASVFGLHPSAIGFNFDVNRSVAETAFEAGRERGLFPTALFLKEMMDRIIQDDLGYGDLEFSWTNIDPTNKAEEAKVVTSLVNTGLMSIDEWRLGEGLKPTGVKDPFIMTPVGPIFVKDLLRQSEEGQDPIIPYKPVTSPAPKPEANVPVPSLPKVEFDSTKSVSEDKDDNVYQEIRKWKKAALNDLKKDQDFREFYSDILDDKTKNLIKKGLSKAQTKEDIVKVFAPFLNGHQQLLPALLKLHDEIDRIISFKSSSVVTAATPGN